MGILDELRSDAEQKKGGELKQEDNKKVLEDAYLHDILPAMQSIFKYLKELVDHLNYVGVAVKVMQYSPRYSQLGVLKQQNYKLSTDSFGGFGDFNRLMQINLSFFCYADGHFTYKVEGRDRIDQEVSFLHSRKVPSEWANAQGSRSMQAATFKIFKNIPVRFRFEVDYNNSQIKLIINNHENFGVQKEIYQAAEINSELLDKIARFLLRKDNDFLKLEMSAVNREVIRQQSMNVKINAKTEQQKALDSSDEEEKHFSIFKSFIKKKKHKKKS